MPVLEHLEFGLALWKGELRSVASVGLVILPRSIDLGFDAPFELSFASISNIEPIPLRVGRRSVKIN